MYNLTFYFKTPHGASYWGGHHLNISFSEAVDFMNHYRRGYFDNKEVLFDLSPIGIN
tara:strand:- start:238 stop:408 length:171 start_codon:yes stop_codon:yes gene_type:complete